MTFDGERFLRSVFRYAVRADLVALLHALSFAPDFVLNVWNLCTMTPNDLFQHVFNIYGALAHSMTARSSMLIPPIRTITRVALVDDDRNGTLDAAECDSLFRLLYHTNELSDDIKQVLKSVDANSDGLLSLGKCALGRLVTLRAVEVQYDVEAFLSPLTPWQTSSWTCVHARRRS